MKTSEGHRVMTPFEVHMRKYHPQSITARLSFQVDALLAVRNPPAHSCDTLGCASCGNPEDVDDGGEE